MPEDFFLQCSHCCSLQQQGEQVQLWKLQRHLTSFCSGNYRYSHSPELTDHGNWKRFPRGAVWLQTRVQHRGHNFVIRQVQKKCIEQNKALFSVFINLTRAVDTVNRDALWMVLERYGCPKKFVRLIQLLHDRMTGQLSLSSSDQSAAFAITNGIKQGCILHPVLFNLFITHMPQAYQIGGELLHVCSPFHTWHPLARLYHNLEVLDHAGCTSIETILIKAQLRWVGNVIRMDNHRLPCQLLYGELGAGKKKQGCPRKQHKDTVRENLQWCWQPAERTWGCSQWQKSRALTDPHSLQHFQGWPLSKTYRSLWTTLQSILCWYHSNGVLVPHLF